MKHALFTKCLTLVSLFALLIFISCSEEDQVHLDNEGNAKNEEALQKYLSNYEVVDIDFKSIRNTAKQKPSTPVDVNLNIDSKPDWNFKLEADPLDVDFTQDFKAFEVKGENEVFEVEMPENHALKGKLGKSTNLSFFLINDEYLEGSIYDQDTEYYLEPLQNYDQKASAEKYVLYKTDDLIPQDEQCTSEDKGGDISMDTDEGIRNVARPWQVEVTMLGDYQLYQKFKNKSRALNYLYYRLYHTNRRHINNNTVARIVTKRLYIYTTYSSRNEYPNGSTLSVSLNQIRNYYNYSWYDRGDVNYFITGDRVSGALGASYFKTICRNPRYAFAIGKYLPAGTLANNLMAHETGHIMGMYHDVSRLNIMHPTLNYSMLFTWRSKSQLSNTLNTQNNCLTH